MASIMQAQKVATEAELAQARAGAVTINPPDIDVITKEMEMEKRPLGAHCAGKALVAALNTLVAA